MIKGSEHIPPRPEQVNSLMMYFVYNYNNDTNDKIVLKCECFINNDTELVTAYQVFA